jgi:hypothetical protein
MTHELVLLSPYRYPAQYAMTLADEDMAAWLNAFTALWHPALLWQAKAAPRVEATYDHETPRPGLVYALPETPPSYLPDDWDARVKEADARSGSHAGQPQSGAHGGRSARCRLARRTGSRSA